MYRGDLGHLDLYASGALIKYFRSRVTDFWDSINIFVIIAEVLITRMVKFLVP